MSRRNRCRWGRVGLAGFGIAFVIHVLTLAGFDALSLFPFLWAMHAAIILYFGFAIVLLTTEQGTRPSLKSLRDNLPGWVRLADGAFFAYMLFNLALCVSLTGGGNADLVNGQYLLMSHSRVLAHLTEGEYHLHKAYELRMFSGSWLCFSALASSYFLFWRHVPLRSTDRLLA